MEMSRSSYEPVLVIGEEVVGRFVRIRIARCMATGCIWKARVKTKGGNDLEGLWT